MHAALEFAEVPVGEWPERAADRDAWRAMVQELGMTEEEKVAWRVRVAARGVQARK
jgi:hypothetical protein